MYPFFGLLNFRCPIFIVPVHISLIFCCKNFFVCFKFRRSVDQRKFLTLKISRITVLYFLAYKGNTLIDAMTFSNF